MTAPTEEREIIGELQCLFCGAECWPHDREWQETTNLLPDAIMFGHCSHELTESLPDFPGVSSFNFCTLECFARWCWQHAVHDLRVRNEAKP